MVTEILTVKVISGEKHPQGFIQKFFLGGGSPGKKISAPARNKIYSLKKKKLKKNLKKNLKKKKKKY